MKFISNCLHLKSINKGHQVPRVQKVSSFLAPKPIKFKQFWMNTPAGRSSRSNILSTSFQLLNKSTARSRQRSSVKTVQFLHANNSDTNANAAVIAILQLFFLWKSDKLFWTSHSVFLLLFEKNLWKALFP